MDFFSEILLLKPTIFVLSETWHSKPFTNNALINQYNLTEAFGVREAEKGRFSGGFLIGINKSESCDIKIVSNNKLCIDLQFELCSEKITTTFTYLPPSIGNDSLDFINEKYNESENWLLIGDLNARIGKFNNYLSTGEQIDRNSKDLTINTRGKALIDILSETNMYILNGSGKKDDQGEFTFMNSNGASVIDLCAVSENLFINNCINKEFSVLQSIYSSHSPILCELSTNDKSEPFDLINEKVKTIKWKSEESEIFAKNLKTQLKGIPTNVIISTHLLVEKIFVAAEHCNMLSTTFYPRKIKYSSRWFDDECKILKAKCQ